MKRKNVEYKQPENSCHSLQEPSVEYQPNYNHIIRQEYPLISKEELNNSCIPLAESKRLLLERIYKDFHK